MSLVQVQEGMVKYQKTTGAEIKPAGHGNNTMHEMFIWSQIQYELT